MPYKNPEDRKEWVRKNSERLNQYQRDNYMPKFTRKSAEENRVKRLYNITPAIIAEMRIAQGDKCAICGGKNKNKALGVDHNHLTGKVRALLCTHCNVGLGYFREDRYVMQKAIDYLSAHWEDDDIEAVFR